MDVDTQRAEVKTQHKGQTYYFCGSQCKQKFDKAPERYAGQKKKTAGK